MGLPLPGITAGIVEKTEDGLRELPVGEVGELALRPGWPSMMREYLHQPDRYAKAFADGWYLSGDLAMRDADGVFLVRGPGRRPDKDLRPPDRPVRGRKRADRT
ncbi:MAG: hypothetical protein ACE368_23295 [Paracoccaceae bacterium]